MMTELEKMKAYHAMEEIKDAPQWARESILVTMCRADESGNVEKIVRILAAHKMPVDEIMPCIMEIMQDSLVHIEADGKEVMK